MSLGDLDDLLTRAVASPDTLGDAPMLEAYHAARYGEVRTRVLGGSALNKASMSAPRPIRDARALGLKLLHDIAPVRRSLMRLGLGGVDQGR